MSNYIGTFKYHVSLDISEYILYFKISVHSVFLEQIKTLAFGKPVIKIKGCVMCIHFISTVKIWKRAKDFPFSNNIHVRQANMIIPKILMLLTLKDAGGVESTLRSGDRLPFLKE